MGVSYTPLLYVGKLFESREDAQEFYRRHFELNEEDLALIDEECFHDFIYGTEFDGDILNYYTEYGGFVFGFDISKAIRDVDKFVGVVKEATEKWNKSFPNEKCEIIHEVQVS